MNLVHSQAASGALERRVSAYPVMVPCVPRLPVGPFGIRVAFQRNAFVFEEGTRNSATGAGVAWNMARAPFSNSPRGLAKLGASWSLCTVSCIHCSAASAGGASMRHCLPSALSSSPPNVRSQAVPHSWMPVLGANPATPLVVSCRPRSTSASTVQLASAGGGSTPVRASRSSL
ncbi:MAG TPA: hypothetical protein VNK05_07770 [Chloroflexota bacterium]|nr:hypothetical protein [Chloroflexota bacterium]